MPADQLQDVVDELDDVGEVTATNLSRQDVTEQTVDLEARIDAAQASVDRLTALMAQAQSVADLIAAEAALSERQALLESYQQQLEMLDDQVAMSTLSVTVRRTSSPSTADPAGFGDGLAAGWNGLVATLNGIVDRARLPPPLARRGRRRRTHRVGRRAPRARAAPSSSGCRSPGRAIRGTSTAHPILETADPS